MNAVHIFLGMVGPWQWIIIGLAILLLFGGKKLPELMKGLGGGIKEFKKATKDDASEDKKVEDKKQGLDLHLYIKKPANLAGFLCL